MIKEFGIYTSEDYLRVLIIVKKQNDKIIGVDIRLQSIEDFTNVNVNNYIFLHVDEIKTHNIFAINLNNNTDVLKDYGYLGQVDKYLRDNLTKQVKNVLDGTGWYIE